MGKIMIHYKNVVTRDRGIGSSPMKTLLIVVVAILLEVCQTNFSTEQTLLYAKIQFLIISPTQALISCR
jgi:hypothetical protein